MTQDLNNTEIRTLKGYWHLPSNPESEVAGIMTIDSDGKIVLELMGQFGDGFDSGVRHEDVIWGRCYDSQKNGASVTLLDCTASYTMNFGLGFPLVRYSGCYALIGIHILSDMDPAFFRALVHIDALTSWCPSDTVRSVHREGEITVSVDTRRGEESVVSSVELDDDLVMKLKKGASYSSDQTKYSIERETMLEVLKEGFSIRKIMSVVHRFEEFLAFAILRPLEHSRIVLFSEQEVQVFDDEKKYYHPIELVIKSNSNIRPTEYKPHTFLFNYKDIVSDFKPMFLKYYTNPSIKQIWSNMMASLEWSPLFTSNDFLIVAQAIDGFSLRFRKESSFLDQLKALQQEFEGVSKMTLTESDLLAVRDSRNYYSHILRIEEKEKRNALDGMALYEITEKLRILLFCCLLSFLGMDNTRINNLMNNCHNSKLPVG